jgi:hypothetical protein
VEQLGVFVADSRGLKTEHRTQHEVTVAERPIGHYHDPVRREKLVIAARADLHLS